MFKYSKRKDGRFETTVTIEKGKTKHLYARTLKELKQKHEEVMIKLGKGLDVSAQRDSFKSWADRWLRLKLKTVSPHKAYCYECRIKNLEPIHYMEISEVRASDLREILLDLSDQYSKGVLTEIKSTAKQILDLAIEDRIIDYNPASSLKVPEGKEPEHEKRRALTAQEQEWIKTTPHRMQTAAMIMLYAGLRRGEVIPLLWTDIDLEKGTISVSKSTEIDKGRMTVKKGAKTVSGNRTVYIPDVLIEYLKTVQTEDTNLLVCHNTIGNLYSDSSWRKAWESYLNELNFKFGDFGKIVGYNRPSSKHAPEKIPFVISRITPHWLRHTFITNLYLSGVDVLTAKEQAGHSNIETTLSIYTHLDTEHKVKQIDKLNEFLNSSSKLRHNKENIA